MREQARALIAGGVGFAAGGDDLRLAECEGGAGGDSRSVSTKTGKELAGDDFGGGGTRRRDDDFGADD